MEEEKKPFVGWNFMDSEGPDREENNLSLDLSLSLGNTSSSATTTTTTSTYDRKGKQVVNYRESRMMCMEINNSSDDDIPLELSLFPIHNVSTDITTTDRKGKQSIVCIKKSISGLSSEPSDSDTDTDQDISTAIFLSLNHRFEVGECSNHHNLKPDDSFTSKKRKTLMEKSSAALSTELSDSNTDDDVWLELSLSLNQRFEAGERSNRHNLKPNDASITSKKRQTSMANPNRKHKRSRVETVGVSTELTLALDPWCIKKKLFPSDVSDMSRLMLASNLVDAHVLPHWNADQLAQIKQGLPVLVWDCNTNTQHEMKFKRWGKGESVLIQNWTPSFVKRRELQQGDEIGLYWDTINSRFNFSVLGRAQGQ